MRQRWDRDKSYNTFIRYWELYRQHYGRHLYKLREDKYPDRYLYKKASESKRAVYSYWNSWLEQRDCHDYGFTVLGGNCHQFTLGAVYRVNATPSHTLYVFRVVTPTKIYEWYITSNTFDTAYIAPVPAHRVYAHNNTNKAWIIASETFIDNNYTMGGLIS